MTGKPATIAGGAQPRASRASPSQASKPTGLEVLAQQCLMRDIAHPSGDDPIHDATGGERLHARRGHDQRCY